METQGYVYQCIAQMKLRIENTKIDKSQDPKRPPQYNKMKYNQDKCKVLYLVSQD